MKNLQNKLQKVWKQNYQVQQKINYKMKLIFKYQDIGYKNISVIPKSNEKSMSCTIGDI